MKQKNKIWIAVFLIPTLVMFMLVYLGPMVLALVSSFTKWDGMQSMRFIGLDNYVKIFQDPVFHASLWHTLFWALLAVAVHVPFGVLVALVLKRKRKGWRFTRSVFMLPQYYFQVCAGADVCVYLQAGCGDPEHAFENVGLERFTRNWLVDSNTALLSVTNIWLWYAAVITLIVLSELSSISSEIEEAARDRRGDSQTGGWYIYLPLLRRAVGTGAIVAVTSVFKEFESIYMTTNGGAWGFQYDHLCYDGK